MSRNGAEYAVGSAVIALAEGRAADALSAAMEAFDVRGQLGIGAQSPREGFILAVEAALVLGDRAAAEDLLTFVEQLPRGKRPQYLEAHARRFRARLAAAGGQPAEAEQRFKRAAAQFRELAAPFWLAVTLLEYGEWLAGEGRGAESMPLLDEARETLRAAPRDALARAPRARRRQGSSFRLVSFPGGLEPYTPRVAGVAESVLRVPNSRIRELAEIAMARRGAPLLLRRVEPAHPGYIKQAAARAMQDGYTFYTENAGLPSRRGAIALISRLHRSRSTRHGRSSLPPPACRRCISASAGTRPRR